MSQPIAVRCVDCRRPTPMESATAVEWTEEGSLYVCTPCLTADMPVCGMKREGFHGRPDVGSKSQPCTLPAGHRDTCLDVLMQSFHGVPTVAQRAAQDVVPVHVETLRHRKPTRAERVRGVVIEYARQSWWALVNFAAGFAAVMLLIEIAMVSR